MKKDHVNKLSQTVTETSNSGTVCASEKDILLARLEQLYNKAVTLNKLELAYSIACKRYEVAEGKLGASEGIAEIPWG